MGSYVNKTSNGLIGSSANEKIDAIVADGGKIIDSPVENQDQDEKI